MHHRLKDVLGDKGRTVHKVPPTATVREAVRVMNDQGIGSVLVLQDDEIVGIFTERDVLTRVVAVGRNPETTLVETVMTEKCLVVSPERTVEETMRIITEKRCRHLPVVDKGTLIGLVSIGDLTRWVTRHQQHEIHELIDYITGRYPG